MKIEIDEGSGFCFGVTTAIQKAEEKLAKDQLYCLGDIVHNGGEVERLNALGLRTIDHNAFATLKNAKVLLRAHGEPPQTYKTARENGIEIIDATCPVVLRLQDRIRKVYNEDPRPQIVIYGKRGHAEVIGLVGQTEGEAIVVESLEEAQAAPIDFQRDLCLFSQTTKSLTGFHALSEYFEQHIQPPARFRGNDTVCRQVANRQPHIEKFAAQHDVIVFVSGKKSSNGKVLYAACQQINPRSYMVDSPEAIEASWFDGANSVGICGATSTPKWLMESCRDRIHALVQTAQ